MGARRDLRRRTRVGERSQGLKDMMCEWRVVTVGVKVVSDCSRQRIERVE